MEYKLWISNLGVLKHIENLGGIAVKIEDNIYEVSNMPAWKLREVRNIFVLNAPRTQTELAYLQAVKNRYSS